MNFATTFRERGLHFPWSMELQDFRAQNDTENAVMKFRLFGTILFLKNAIEIKILVHGHQNVFKFYQTHILVTIAMKRQNADI